MTLIDYLVEQGSEVYALFPNDVEELVFMNMGFAKIFMLIFLAVFSILIAFSCIYYVYQKFNFK